MYNYIHQRRYPGILHSRSKQPFYRCQNWGTEPCSDLPQDCSAGAWSMIQSTPVPRVCRWLNEGLHFAKGRSLSCPQSKPAQLLPALKPVFSHFLLLRIACAKLNSICMWELHIEFSCFEDAGLICLLGHGIIQDQKLFRYFLENGWTQWTTEIIFWPKFEEKQSKAVETYGTAYLCKSINMKCYCFTACALCQEFLL